MEFEEEEGYDDNGIEGLGFEVDPVGVPRPTAGAVSSAAASAALVLQPSARADKGKGGGKGGGRGGGKCGGKDGERRTKDKGKGKEPGKGKQGKDKSKGNFYNMYSDLSAMFSGKGWPAWGYP